MKKKIQEELVKQFAEDLEDDGGMVKREVEEEVQS